MCRCGMCLCLRYCTDENWDDWQPPTADQDEERIEDDYTERQVEPHCEDPDFIVCTVLGNLYRLNYQHLEVYCTDVLVQFQWQRL